jgi:hypothetical protein
MMTPEEQAAIATAITELEDIASETRDLDDADDIEIVANTLRALLV